jgi:hypothetical protein
MTNLAQWSALVGFLLPLVVAVIQRPTFSRRLRTVIGIAASAGTAVLTALIEGKLTWNNWATSFIFVAVTAWASYGHVWVPAGAAPYIEAKTSP